MMNHRFPAAALALIAVFAASAAHAQDALVAVRDAAWAVALPIVLSAIATIGGIALAYVRRGLNAFEERTGIQMDKARVEALENAISNVFAELERTAGGATPEGVIRYLREFNPGTLSGLGLSGARLKERVEAGIARRRQDADLAAAPVRLLPAERPRV